MFIKYLLYAYRRWRNKIETEYNEEVMRLMQQRASLPITPTMSKMCEPYSAREEHNRQIQKEIQDFNEKTKTEREKRKQYSPTQKEIR